MPFSSTKTPLFYRLVLTWVLMAGLTGLGMFSGDVFETRSQTTSIGFISVGILMVTTLFKCRLLLLDFLELRHVAPEWRRGFLFAIAIIVLMISATYALAFGIELPTVS